MDMLLVAHSLLQLVISKDIPRKLALDWYFVLDTSFPISHQSAIQHSLHGLLAPKLVVPFDN